MYRFYDANYFGIYKDVHQIHTMFGCFFQTTGLAASRSDVEPPLPSQTRGLIVSVYLSVKMFDL